MKKFFMFVAMAVVSACTIVPSQAQEKEKTYKYPDFDITFYEGVTSSVREAINNPNNIYCYGILNEPQLEISVIDSADSKIFFFPLVGEALKCFFYSEKEKSKSASIDIEERVRTVPVPSEGKVAVMYSNKFDTVKGAINAIKNADVSTAIINRPEGDLWVNAVALSPSTLDSWFKRNVFTKVNSLIGNSVPKAYQKIIDDFKPRNYKYRYIVIFKDDGRKGFGTPYISIVYHGTDPSINEEDIIDVDAESQYDRVSSQRPNKR